jgi:heme/copper-type cytochrome/quinol oxidase subunit 2
MPWTTLAVVFGSWVLLLVLTLLYYLVWSLRRHYGDGEDER